MRDDHEGAAHQLVDEMSDAEAEDVLRVIVAPLEHEVSPRIVLGDDEAQRFLDALDNPVVFEPRLQRLVGESQTPRAAASVSPERSAGETS